MELKQKYIQRIKKATQDYIEKIQYLTIDVKTKRKNIIDNYAVYPPKISGAKNYLKEFRDGAWRDIGDILFWGELKNADFNNLPFQENISIYVDEDFLHSLVVKHNILYHYLNFLNLQEENLKNTTKNDDIKDIPYTNKEIIHFNSVGMLMMNMIDAKKNKKSRIDLTRKLCKYIITKPDIIKILDTNRVFKTRSMLPIRIKNNLMDIRYKYNIREAGVWWRLIFGTRIPVDPEYEFVMVPNPNSI